MAVSFAFLDGSASESAGEDAGSRYCVCKIGMIGVLPSRSCRISRGRFGTEAVVLRAD